jgi:hypothetical protein
MTKAMGGTFSEEGVDIDRLNVLKVRRVELVLQLRGDEGTEDQ